MRKSPVRDVKYTYSLFKKAIKNLASGSNRKGRFREDATLKLKSKSTGKIYRETKRK